MKSSQWKIILLILFLISASLACELSGNLPELIDQVDSQPEPTLAALPENIPSSGIIVPDYVMAQDAMVNLYEQVSPGVVSIQVVSNLGTAQGSGFVIDKQGHIVTNFHVVEGAVSLEVDFSSGLKTYGEVIGTDLDSDLAVIKVDVNANDLTPLPLGDSDQARVGQTVVAIGNPYGLSGTMTVGIVSARGRLLDSIRQTADGMYFTAGDLIQTDASINPGNSGGPLLNLNGEVIGVNRAIRTESSSLTGEAVNSGIGFAVSSNIVRRVVPVLISQGFYDYPYLGMSSLNSLDLTLQEVLDLPQATGAYITNVTAGGPASEAGIIAGTQATSIPGYFAGGDLIISIDGNKVNEFSDLLSYMILNKMPGDQVTFTLLRNNETIDITVTLGKRP
ncbi:MAG: trypsin-like peptidase domain-containing protein [Anaerolineaceae bacterium]|nr:trypsin-like peptidase domain-containing protein [Anaerolineaceae bacterium]